MAAREFPLSPRTTAVLEVGDLVAVRRDDGRWGCLQVTDLKRTGTGSRTSLMVGVLPWVGEAPPTMEVVRDLKITEQGLTGVEIFTRGGLDVVGAAPVVDHGLPSNFSEHGIGVTVHVWGWRTAIEKVNALEP